VGLSTSCRGLTWQWPPPN